MIKREWRIRGKTVTKAEFIKELLKHGGQVVSIAACEIDNVSKTIWTDGIDIFEDN